MTNREKFAKEILDVACAGERVAIDKRTMRTIGCSGFSCGYCLFGKADYCNEEMAKWAESEYIEQPKISKKDRVFLDYLIEEYKFVARDKNGKLFVCEAHPRKWEKYWYLSHGRCLSLNRCFNIDFPMVKWSDAEPWKIEDLKKLEVCENYEID